MNNFINPLYHDDGRVLELAALEQSSGILIERFGSHHLLRVSDQEPFVLSGIKAGW